MYTLYRTTGRSRASRFKKSIKERIKNYWNYLYIFINNSKSQFSDKLFETRCRMVAVDTTTLNKRKFSSMQFFIFISFKSVSGKNQIRRLQKMG